MKKILLLLFSVSGFAIADSGTDDANASDREDVGIIEAAPSGKYATKPESTIYEQPAFIDSSSPSGGSGAEVPIAPYIIVGIDFDQQGSIDGAKNGGTVPFTDNGAYFTLGADKKVSDSWILGGYIKQKGTFAVQQNDASPPAGGNGYNPSFASTEIRIQAAYATEFGLANIVRVDGLSGAYGAPGFQFSPVLRVEDFTRYDTQYDRAFYQFAAQRLRYRSDGGWDARWILGQGLQFNNYNTYEVSLIQDFAQAGEVNGIPLYVNGTNDSQFLAGTISKQLLANSYTHVFGNKTSLTLNANWVGSSYYTSNYQSGFELEASFRVPF